MADIKDFKHAIVRQKILDAVRKDLIGPASDCEQLNEVPTSSYITGLLYPADTDVTEDENYNEVEFTEKNFDADGETLEAGIFEEEEPEDRVKGGFQKPSSIGVSFYVSDDVQKVNAYINWGKYYAEQVHGEVIDETLEEDAENKKKKKHTMYIREQMNDVVEIDFNEMGRSKQIPLESNGNIYIYVMKMQLDNGYKMVSVYLHNNDKSDGDEKEYEKVMFQVEMLIADDLMSPIFVPEYLCRKVELEDEYYYKGRPVYARGRGCAATWEKKAEEINATAIKSSFIPDYEIPSVSAQIDDMPEHTSVKIEYIAGLVVDALENYSVNRENAQFRLVIEELSNHFTNCSEEEITDIISLCMKMYSSKKIEHAELVLTAPDSFHVKALRTKDTMRNMIENTEKSLTITGYSISDYFAEMLDVIIKKSLQGVYVRLYLNDTEKQKEVLNRLMSYRSRFLQIYEYQKQEDDKMAALHAKLIVSDVKKSLVSSANLSYHGMQGNIEMGFLIESHEKAKQIEEVMKEMVRMKVFGKQQ